jgi:hypothetical protein
MNAIGLFVTTAGALLIFVFLRNAAQFAQNLDTPERKATNVRNLRLASIAVGLLAAWLVIQDLAVIFL